MNYIPFVSEFGANISVNDAFALRVTLQASGIFILLFFFSTFSSRTHSWSWRDAGQTLAVMIFVLHVGLLVSVTLSFPTDLVDVLSQFTRALFLSDIARAAWVLLPVIAMALFGGGKEDRGYGHYS